MEDNENSIDPKTDFLKSVNGTEQGLDMAELSENALLKIVEKEVDPKEVINKLFGCEQDRIKVRTIILDSRLDFVNSARKLQSVFNTELDTITSKLNEKYNSEMLKIKQLFRKEFIGTGLMDLVNEVNENGWVLVMKKNSANLYKCYYPPFPVSEGCFEDGRSREYSEPITYLRGIYLNILHPKVTSGSIYLQTEGGTHPNCAAKGFGAACPGTLQDREIPVTELSELICLLDEISATYEKMHLDSAYYTPTQNFTERKEKPLWITE